MTSSSAATDSEKDKPSAPVVGELGDAIADSELRQLFEAVTESLHHKVDPELMRSVSSQEVELSADSTLFDVITSRASLLGIRMTRLPVTPFEVVTMPMHQLPLVVERADGGLGVVNATRAFRARVRWEDNEAWLGPKALATWLGASNDRERVIAMDAELALPLTGGPASHDRAGAHDDGHGGGHGHGHGGIERLFSVMQLERGDLFSVFIYAVFIGLSTLIVPIAVQAVVNTVAFATLVQPLIVLTLLVLGFLAFNGLLRALQAVVVERLQQRFFVRAAMEFAHRIPRIEVDAFDRVHAPEKVNRFFDVMTVQKAAASLLLDGLLLTLQALVGMILLGFYHPFLLAFDFVLLLAIVGIVFGLGRKAVATSLDESAAKYDLVAWLQDMARSPVAFRMNQDAALERTDDFARRYLLARRRHFAILFRQIVGSVALQAVASAVLLAIGGLLVLDGQLTIGQLVAAELVVTSIVAGVAKLGKHLESYYDLRTGLEKIGSVTDLALERNDAMRTLPTAGPAKLELSSIRFAHRDRPPVHDGLSIHVNPGEKLAVLGLHGAGKSTIADLAFGLRSVSRGAILLDGVDLREIGLSELRRHVALVRDIEIFDGSVFDNVALWRRDVTPQAVNEALAAVGLGEAVARLKNGVKSHLLTGGNPLSLGQAQRLMLARALAGRPRLLVIDGLLDGLDEASLLELEQCLISVCRGKTTLLVLTSLESVAAWCDRSVVLSRRATMPPPSLPPKPLGEA
jgi:putative ABC transport system ATP-binding protein